MPSTGSAGKTDSPNQIEAAGLCKEAQEFVYESVMNLQDTPLKTEGLLDVEEVMLEFAMYEELQMRKDQELLLNKSG